MRYYKAFWARIKKSLLVDFRLWRAWLFLYVLVIGIRIRINVDFHLEAQTPAFYLIEDGYTLALVHLPFYWLALVFLNWRTTSQELIRYKGAMDLYSMGLLDCLFFAASLPLLFCMIYLPITYTEEFIRPGFGRFFSVLLGSSLIFFLYGLLFYLLKYLLHSPLVALTLLFAINLWFFYSPFGYLRAWLDYILVYDSMEGMGILSSRSLAKIILVALLLLLNKQAFKRQEVVL